MKLRVEDRLPGQAWRTQITCLQCGQAIATRAAQPLDESQSRYVSHMAGPLPNTHLEQAGPQRSRKHDTPPGYSASKKINGGSTTLVGVANGISTYYAQVDANLQASQTAFSNPAWCCLATSTGFSKRRNWLYHITHLTCGEYVMYSL